MGCSSNSAPEVRSGKSSDTFTTPNGAQTFVRGRFDADPLGADPESGRDLRSHFSADTHNFRSFCQDRTVNVLYFPSGVLQFAARLPQKNEG